MSAQRYSSGDRFAAASSLDILSSLPIFPGVSQHNQLTRIVEMLGSPPDALVERGKNSHKYFCRGAPGRKSSFASLENKSGKGGMPYEPHRLWRLKTAEEYAAETNSDVPVLRKYLRYSRLEEVILKCPLINKSRMSASQKADEMRHRKCFLDFLQGLLRIDPSERWTAKQAAGHPFITGAPFTGEYIPSDRKVESGANVADLSMSTPKSPGSNLRHHKSGTSSSSSPVHRHAHFSSASEKAPSQSPSSRLPLDSRSINSGPAMSGHASSSHRRRSLPYNCFGSYPNHSTIYENIPEHQAYAPPNTTQAHLAFSMGYGGSYSGAPHIFGTMQPAFRNQPFVPPSMAYDPRQLAFSSSSTTTDFGIPFQPGSYTIGGNFGSQFGSTKHQPYFLTDFGQALIRPDINEHRLMMSQQEESNLYWQNQGMYASSFGSLSGSYASPRYSSYTVNNYPSSLGKETVEKPLRQGSFNSSTRRSSVASDKGMKGTSHSAAQDSVEELALRLDGAFEGIKGYGTRAVTFAESMRSEDPPVSGDLDEDFNADWEPFFAADDLDLSAHGSQHGFRSRNDDGEEEPRVVEDELNEKETGKSLPQSFLLMQHQLFMNQQRNRDNDG